MFKNRFNFVHNCFVIESENSYMTLQPTTYIIPYYAVQSVEIFNNYVVVQLKNQLSSFDSFDKRIYRISKENNFEVYFNDEKEKQFFLKSINKMLNT